LLASERLAAKDRHSDVAPHQLAIEEPLGCDHARVVVLAHDVLDLEQIAVDQALGGVDLSIIRRIRVGLRVAPKLMEVRSCPVFHLKD
jgi:hypothetical protein